MLRIDTLDDTTLATVETAARRESRRLGYRANQIIHLERSVQAYEQRIHATALSVAGQLRGLCGPAGGLHRAVWVAPGPEMDFLESLSHEIAHAVLPLRAGHTTDWLAVATAALGAISTPQHCANVRSWAQHRYQI